MSQVKFLSLALILLIAVDLPRQAGATPQASDQPKAQSKSKAQQHAASNSKAVERPSGLNLAPVSTAEAGRIAAEDIAKRRSEPKHDVADKPASSGSEAGRPDQPGVVEFKPASTGDSTTDNAAVVPKDSKKSMMKNIHGSAGGSLNPNHAGNHETATSVGATSKGGRTSVYVETDDAHTAPPPH